MTRYATLAALAAGLLLAGSARAVPPGVPDLGAPCSRCHTTSGWEVLPEKVAFEHARTGFALRGRHASVRCADCHGRAMRTAKARGACRTCHQDKHRGALGTACERCHNPTSWAQTAAFREHRATRFPLVGSHAAVDCTACHIRGRQKTYAGTPTDCFACHAADYRRSDIHPNHVRAGFRTQCDTCHSQYLWRPARVRHDMFWPLRGAHAVAACYQCHPSARYGGTSRACDTCHAAEYKAAADPPHAAYQMSRRCDLCHDVYTWKPAAATWHDGVFPINSGHHAGFQCNDCHFQNRAPASFTCIRCHTYAATAGRHDDVRGFVFENFACFACHPRGAE